MADINGIISSGSNFEVTLNSGQKGINSDIVNDEGNINTIIKEQAALTKNMAGTANLNSDIYSNNDIAFNLPNNIHTNSNYVYIRYSHKRPTSNEEILISPDDLTYFIGIYTGASAQPPESYTAYTWTQFRGDKGEQGDKGDKGDKGEATLTINNALHFVGYLNQANWTLSYDKDLPIYSQIIEVTNQLLYAQTMTDEELIEYMDLNLTDKMTPLVDLLFEENESIESSKIKIEEWKWISRIYLTKEKVLVNQEIVNKFFFHFECYEQAPDVQLKYQIKVI